MKHSNLVAATNQIVENEQGILEIRLFGVQSAASTREVYEQVQRYVDKRVRQNKKRMIVVDMTKLSFSDADSEARAESRKMLTNLRVDVIACVGDSVLVNLATYVIRLSNPQVKVIYCQTIAKANRQLLAIDKPRVAHSEVALFASVSIIIIGVLGILGWWLSNPYFKGFLPGLRPINPTAAAVLVILGIAFFCYWKRARVPLRLMGASGVLVGLLALSPFSIDYLFFQSQVLDGGPHVRLADSAAVCFILSGCMGLLAWRNGNIVRILQYITAGAMIGIALFSIYGQLYAHDYIYGISDSFVMALNLAVAFLIAGVSFVLLVIYRQMGGVLTRVSKVGWLVVVSLLFVQLATYSAWSQSVSRNKEDTAKAFQTQADKIVQELETRIQAYTDALHGFAGLFAASEYVSQGEFESYYQSLNLKENYPGLRSIAFISRVPTSQLAAFEKLHQQDTSLNSGGNPNFKIQPPTAYDPHYIATYVPDNPTNAGLGTDVTSIPGRYDIYTNAVASGQTYASGTIVFRKTDLRPEAKGFFITFPVKNVGSKDYVGLVNANFDYPTLFSKLFGNGADRDTEIVIRDAKDNDVLFRDNQRNGEVAHAQAREVPVANRTWKVSISTDKMYGINTFQTKVPMLILVVGQVFTALLILIFVSQARSRKRAFELADLATSDLQKERQAVLALNKKDEAILSGIGEGLISINSTGIIELANAASLKQLGFTQSEVIGKHYTEVLPVFDAEGQKLPEKNRPMHKVLNGHKVISTTVYYQHRNGALFPARINVAPVVIEGKIAGAIEVFQDITKELELDKAKSEFVSLASHQLRTPLSAIGWYTEMLLSGDAGKVTKGQAEYLDEIDQGNRRMVELVDSLLNVSRLELGKLRNDPVDTSMIEIAASLEKEMEGAIEKHNIDYKHQFEKDLPKVYADPKLLRIIVQNLFSNAVKYTPDGGSVRMTMRRATKSEITRANLVAGTYVFLSVSDTGYGIPEAQRSKIFQKMFRADNVRKLDVEGTGLGLYIVQESVKLFGGAIWFESKESVGTTFYAIIPTQTKSRP